jgi:CRP-like cAMP-binding protein
MDVTSGFLLCWSSVIEPYRFTCNAHAVEAVRMMKFDGPKLRELMEKDHDLGYALMKQIAYTISDRLKSIRTMFISLASA